MWNEYKKQSLLFSPNENDLPIFSQVRNFMGEKELVILYYTKRCRYQCSFCSLPLTSSKAFIDHSQINRQLLSAFKNSYDFLDQVTAIAIGNEGSVFDEETFSEQSLDFNIALAKSNKSLNRISFETRHEFITDAIVSKLDELQGIEKVLKIGFETYNENIRANVLNKKFTNGSFLEALDKIANKGIVCSAYVLIHCDYSKSPEDGINECKFTCQFLIESCKERNIPLILRLNPMYGALDMPWTKKAKEHSWSPLSFQQVISLVKEIYDTDYKFYIGASDEGLAEDGLSFMDVKGSKSLLPLVKKFNNTQNVSDLSRT